MTPRVLMAGGDDVTGWTGLPPRDHPPTWLLLCSAGLTRDRGLVVEVSRL